MARTEKLFLGKKLVGIKIKSLAAGSLPVTDAEAPLQVLTLRHPKGASNAAHYHRKVKRVTHTLQECLVVVKGRIRIEFFDAKKKPAARSVVKAGQAFIVLDAPNRVVYLEDSEIIEVKNGPFRSDAIKIV